MTDLRDLYADSWVKSASQENIILETVKVWFEGWPLKFELGGHGSGSMEYDDSEHEKSTPDILIRGDLETTEIIGAIEVTGSNKVVWPVPVWIAKHKQDFANSVPYPVAYALFYGQEQRFTTARVVEVHRLGIEERYPRGVSELYYILSPHMTGSILDLRSWIEGIARCYIRDSKISGFPFEETEPF